MIELLPPCGIEHTGDEPRHRPSTNEECGHGTASLIVPRLEFDVRKPIPNQVTNWLRTIASELVAAADQIDLIEDGRDLAEVKRLIRAA